MKQSNKREAIRVMSKVVEHEGINYPEYDYLKVSTSKVIRYGKSLILLKNLNGLEQTFLHYLTEIMDSNNVIINSPVLKANFIAYMASDGSHEYSINTIKVVMSKLSKSPFLINQGKRGVYQINPLYFCKNSTHRDKLIKDMKANKNLI